MHRPFTRLFITLVVGSTALLGIATGTLTGCGPLGSLANSDGTPTGLAADVAAKAEQVAQQIGGAAGFGGPLMNGYIGHMDDHMGFHSAAALASNGGTLSVTFTNHSAQACVFHFSYLRSADGLDTQTRDLNVPAGQSVTINMPCAEIVGMGGLTEVGAVAGTLADGTSLGNQYCVPGFLNSDYACGGEFRCSLAPDVNDVDQDGDTQELVMLTSAMQEHMALDGMQSHMDGDDALAGRMMSGFGMAQRP